MTAVQRPQLEVVVGWLPGGPERSLSVGSRALAPAVLYADRVQVICPQSDDALEMQDYFDLKDAMPGTVEFMALDSMYTQLDARGKPVKNPDGGYYAEPFAPEVWANVLETHMKEAEDAGTADHRIREIARASVLLEWGDLGEERILEWLVSRLSQVDVGELKQGMNQSRRVHDEVIGEWLLGAFTQQASLPRKYALLDDPAGLLSSTQRATAAVALDRYARTRSAEAALGAAVLSTLPSPNASSGWDVIADVRADLELPLARFRGAMAELSSVTEEEPLAEDFDQAVEQALRVQVWPALAELEELVREASFRQIFFRDVAGDLTAYSGPLIGLGVALSDSMPGLLSVAVGVATPFAASVAHRADKRRAIAEHRFFFVRESGRRLGAAGR